jgi:hypothetical protein
MNSLRRLAENVIIKDVTDKISKPWVVKIMENWVERNILTFVPTFS